MRKQRKLALLGILLGIPLASAAALLLYLKFADLSGWRDTAASLVSDAIGREFAINGEFEPEIGLTTRVVASDITLANPDGSADPHMVSVDHLAFEVDLLSFFFGPITIHDVEITGARVLFDVAADGRFNWNFADGDSKSSPAGGGGEFQLIISHARLGDIELAYTPAGGTGLGADLDHLEFRDDGTGMLDLDLAGSFKKTPLEISGRLGTFVGLINANSVNHDLKGTLGGAEFSLNGTIDDLSALTGVDAVVTAGGPDLRSITTIFGLDQVVEGPFTITASAKPLSSGSKIDLDVVAGDLDAHMTGTVDSLTRPKTLDATVTAAGPDIRTVGELAGVTGLPAQGYSVTGGFRWEGFPITFRKVEISIGDNTLSADGVLGAPPKMLGTDFTVRGKGPDLSLVGALAGIDLPGDHYSVEGRILRVENGLRFEQVQANVGRTELRVEGTVGDPPDYAGTTLTIHAEGPSLTDFDNLLGLALPAEPFSIDGRFVEKDYAIGLEGVNAQFGRSSLRVDGTLTTGQRFSGSTLQISARGPDATDLRALEVLEDLPSEAWSLMGGVSILRSGLRLDGVTITVGSLEVHGDGRLSTMKGLVGSDLQIQAEDPDLSHAVSIFGVAGFPEVTAAVEGRLRVETDGYRLDGVKGSAGDIDVAVDGLIGSAAGLDGTTGHLSVHGPRLSSLGPFLRQTGLPPASFSITGNVAIEGGAYQLSDVVAKIDQTHARVNGRIVPAHGLVGTDVQIEASAPDLGQTGHLVEGLFALPELPAKAARLETRLHIVESGYEIDSLRATLDQAKVKIDGHIGVLPGLVGTDLTIEGDGPDASLFRALTGVEVPVEPFEVSGNIKRTESAYVFDRVAIRLAGHSVTLHGSLGERPHLIGTDLDLHASGPGTRLIADLTGFDKLPDEPFEIGGSFEGTPEKFTADGLAITLGDSDIEGSLEVDIRSKSEITARLSSKHLDFARLTPGLSRQGDETAAEPAAPEKSKGQLVFSKDPIDFALLHRANADVQISVATLQMPVERFREFELNANLVEGRLDIHRLAMTGSRGGSGSGSFVLEPNGGAYRADLALDINGIRLNPADLEALSAGDKPPIDIDIRLQAQGSSAHEFAGSSNGSIQIIAGAGVLDNRVFDMISADILLTLLKAFNPFSKEEAATELECAVIHLQLDQGMATLDPMALQSDKMTMLGDGEIDLGSERLDLEWVTKPRKGIGISASMITNPYIKLGGTLGKPAIELKPMQAAASTGVAVATMGISLVAKGMLDRVTAEKKVCEKALEKIGRNAASSATNSSN